MRNTPLLDEIRSQVAVHGNAFWEALEIVEPPIGLL